MTPKSNRNLKSYLQKGKKQKEIAPTRSKKKELDRSSKAETMVRQGYYDPEK
jgi:hypothetical protein